MVEPRQVDVLAADAAIVAGRRADQRRQVAGRVEADLLTQVAADHVGTVAQAVGVALRP